MGLPPLKAFDIKRLIRDVSAYIPATLVHRILQEGLPAPGHMQYLQAATLFFDISGFTRMSEELVSDGPRGAEEVTRVLETTFGVMIQILQAAGGAISHFYGDAVMVYFPDLDGTAAQRALGSAQQMQALMLGTLGEVMVKRPQGKPNRFSLTIKIGLGYGECLEIVVGDSEKYMEFVLTGVGIEEAGLAEKQAMAGQVIASYELLKQVNLPTDSDFQSVTEKVKLLPPQPILQWNTYSDAQLWRLAQEVTPFLPPNLYQRLQTSHTGILAEHRPITSLFVQFAGIDFKQAMAGELLQTYYQWATKIVERHGTGNSHLNRILTGDKGNQLHIFFGAPIAPDDPDQAVRCALALQKEKPEFIKEQKIGIATGRVFAGPIGSEARAEYTIVGDVVNLSSRLTSVCPVGQVWIDEGTALRSYDKIHIEVLKPVLLKGKQMPVPVFRAIMEKPDNSQITAYFSRWDKPFIGRQDKLTQLQEYLQQAWLGKTTILALSGSMGVGKSRLLGTGVDWWLNNGGAGVLGICYQHTTTTPFAPWFGVWQEFFNLALHMGPVQQMVQILELTHTLCPEYEVDTPLWGEVLGLPIQQPEHLSQLTAEARQVRFFQMVRAHLQAAANKKPLLIILEDVHWADQASLDLLDYLSDYLTNYPICIVTTHSSEETLPAKFMQTCFQIEIGEFSPDEAREFVKLLTGYETLPASLEVWLGLRDQTGRDSSVNPLYLEEALHVLQDQNLLHGEKLDSRIFANLQVPDSIYGLLLARLDRLPARQRSLLQVASVIGRQFDVDTLTHILPTVSHEQMMGLLQSLTDAELTQSLATDPNITYLFYHAMTRNVVYESLPYAERQTFHGEIAGILEEKYYNNLEPYYPLLAYHYGQTELHDKAFDYALHAANDATVMYANKEAVKLYTLAENHLKTLEDTINWQTICDLYIARGRIFIRMGDFTNAEPDLTKALALAVQHKNIVFRAKTGNWLAEIKYRQSKYEEVHQLTSWIIPLDTSQIPSKELVQALLWAGWAYAMALDYEQSMQLFNRAMTICKQTNNNYHLSLIWEAIAYVYYMQKELQLALESMQKGVELSRKFNTPLLTGQALNNVATIQFELGLANDSSQTLQEAITLAKNSSQRLLALVLATRAGVSAYLGHWQEAQNHFTQAEELLNIMDDEYTLIELHLRWGYLYYAALQEWQLSLKHLKLAQLLLNKQPKGYLEEKVRLSIGLALIELNIGTSAQALTYAQNAHQIASKTKLAWWYSAVFYYKALAYLQMNNLVKAREYLQQARTSIIHKQGSPYYLAPILFELAQLEMDRAQKISYLHECLQAIDYRSHASIKKKYKERVVQEIKAITNKTKEGSFVYGN